MAVKHETAVATEEQEDKKLEKIKPEVECAIRKYNTRKGAIRQAFDIRLVNTTSRGTVKSQTVINGDTDKMQYLFGQDRQGDSVLLELVKFLTDEMSNDEAEEMLSNIDRFAGDYKKWRASLK